MSKKSKPQHQSLAAESKEPAKVVPEVPLILSKKYLQPNDLQLLENSTPDKVEQYLAKLFGLSDYEIDLKTACFLDYYVTQYWWAAKQKQFNQDQVATYFTIAYLLMDNVKDKKFKLCENVDNLKDMLCELNEKHKIYTEEQLKDIISHLALTFFQNFKIFNFVVNQTQPEVFITREIEIECPKPPFETLYPLPLDEAIPEPYYNKYILKIPDPPTEEELARLEAEKPENMALSEDVIEEIRSRFGDLSIDDARRIIYEVTNEVVAGLKTDMKAKIKEKETALLNELNKNAGKKKK